MTGPSPKKPNPVDIHVGSRVRMRRTMLGMSQEKLGESLGITFQQVQKYEKGANRIGASRLQQISNVLDTPVSFFFEDMEGSDDKATSQPEGMSERGGARYVMDFLASAEGLQLNKAFMQVKDPKVRRKIVELVKSIASEDE